MAHPSATARAARRVDNPLQRGSACLSCRKRKMKCDASKPVCRQCVRADRCDDCEYDDGRQKSRTQMLQEKIARLEDRLRELDASASAGDEADVNSLSPSSSRFNQASHAHAAPLQGSPLALFGSSASGSGSPPSVFLGSPPSHTPERYVSVLGTQSPEALLLDGMYHLHDDLGGFPKDYAAVDMPDPMATAMYSQFEFPWYEAEELAPQDRNMLFDIFLPHSRQCGLDVHAERLRASFDGYSEAPHPALCNAIYTLACHFAHSPALTDLAPHFLARALRGIAASLEHSDRLVHAVQASALLAVYFYGTARVLEGYYHASAAARLAATLGLHQQRAPVHAGGAGLAFAFADAGVPLPPPGDALAHGARVAAFWQVFFVDRCWAAATGLPPGLADDDHPQLCVTTAWPRSVREYEMGLVTDGDDGAGLEALFAGAQTRYAPYAGVETLRAKAAALFERSARVAAGCLESGKWDALYRMEYALSQFAAALPGILVPQHGPHAFEFAHAASPRVDVELAAVHTLVYAATIQLHPARAAHQQQQPALREKARLAARAVTAVIAQLSELDYAFLDPIVGTCWVSAADIFIHDRQFPASDDEHGLYSPDQEIGKVLRALRLLGHTFSLAFHQAEKIQRSFDVGI